jgi:hypothetical protein
MFGGLIKPKCCVCKRGFDELPKEIAAHQTHEITDAVSRGKFRCGCKAYFHGKCGKGGQVNPKSVTLTCPKCQQMFKSALPFVVLTSTKRSPQAEAYYLPDHVAESPDGEKKRG